MKAFVATSIRNSEEALRVIRILESLSISHQCCLTEIETMRGQELFDHYVKGIRDADIFISVLKNAGKDLSTEIGIAYSLNKKCIGVIYDASPADTMLYYAAGTIIPEKNLEDTLKYIQRKDAFQKRNSTLQFSNFDQHKFSNVISEITNIFESQSFVGGKNTSKLEQKLSERYDRPVITASSGTTALIMALDVLLKNKKEVIVPSLTFNATIQAIIHAGGEPVFADIDPYTWTLNTKNVERRITKKTGAILPVNLFGVPANITEFRKLSEHYRIPLIYDSCQAFGAVTPFGEIGTFGDVEVFSLDSTKSLSGILGGFITIKNKELYDNYKYAKEFGNGTNKETTQRGLNGRFSEFNAVFALKSLATVEKRLRTNKITSLKYKEALSSINKINFQEETHGISSPQYFGIFIDYRKMTVKTIQEELKKQNIETRIYNPTLLHKLDFFTNKKYVLPVTEKMHERILCLPTHEKTTDYHMDIIVKTIRGNLK